MKSLTENLTYTERNGVRNYLIAAAEDNEADVFLIREALGYHHVPCDLKIFDNGEGVVKYIDALDRDGAAQIPDLLLLDLNLPKKSGVEVCMHLRQSRRCSNIPVVIVTSSNSPADRAVTTRLGVSAYFHKPPDLDRFLTLGSLVEDLLPPREGVQ